MLELRRAIWLEARFQMWAPARQDEAYRRWWASLTQWGRIG